MKQIVANGTVDEPINLVPRSDCRQCVQKFCGPVSKKLILGPSVVHPFSTEAPFVTGNAANAKAFL